MEQKIIEFISRYGYFGIFGLITAENLFPPIPSEIILTAGGFLTTCTSMSVLGTTIFATFGSILGAIILYYVGRLLTPEKLLALLRGPLGRFLHFQIGDVLRSIENFKNKGSKAVFLCRFVPILRSLISLPAGMSKMDPLPFLLYTILGSFGWNFILIYLGSVLGSHHQYFLGLYQNYSILVKIGLILAAVIWLYRTIKRKNKKR